MSKANGLETSLLEKLTQRLRARGLEVSPAEAEKIALHNAGSVREYLELLDENDRALERIIEPRPGPVSGKFSDPLAYTVHPPCKDED